MSYRATLLVLLVFAFTALASDEPFPPAFPYLAHTRDLTNFSPFTVGTNMLPAFDTKCSDRTTRNPVSQKLSCIPDACNEVQYPFIGFEVQSTVLTNSAAEFAAALSESLGGGIDALFASASLSVHFEQFMSLNITTEYIIAITVGVFSAVEMDLESAVFLTPAAHAVQAVNTTLTRYGAINATNFDQWMGLVHGSPSMNGLGTHYCSKFTGGASAFFIQIIERAGVAGRSSTDIQAQAEANALFLLKAKGDTSINATAAASWYTSATTTAQGYYGGNSGTYSEWKASAALNPAAFSLTWAPVEAVMPASLAPDVKAVRKAAENYATMTYISKRLTSFTELLTNVAVKGDPTCPVPSSPCTWDCGVTYKNSCPCDCGAGTCENGGSVSCCGGVTPTGTAFDDIVPKVVAARNATLPRIHTLQLAVEKCLYNRIVTDAQVLALGAQYTALATIVDTPMVKHSCVAKYTHDASQHTCCNGYRNYKCCFVAKCPGATLDNDASLSYPSGLLNAPTGLQ